MELADSNTVHAEVTWLMYIVFSNSALCAQVAHTDNDNSPATEQTTAHNDGPHNHHCG